MVGPLVLAAVALGVFYLGRDHELWSFGAPGAGLLPAVAAGLLLVASLAALWDRKAIDEPPAEKRRVAGYVAGLVAIVPATAVIGLLPALALFVALILRFVERLRTGRALAIAGISALASWLLFERLLAVPLPWPMFW